MKHTLKITVILLTLFLVAQFMGIFIIYSYIDQEQSATSGKVEFRDLPIGERPPEEDNWSFLPIIFAVFAGTGLAFVLVKYKLVWVWKIWFLFAITATLGVAFGAVLPVTVALVLGLIFALWKVFGSNIFVHNGTELLIYGGLAALFVPMLTLFSVSILFVLIAIYDAYAVWKSKHMIRLAQEQQKAKLFAGFLVPYSLGKTGKKLSKQEKVVESSATVTTAQVTVRTALLCGGDVAFPILFAGVVLKELGLFSALVIPFFALLGLGFLMWKSEQKKFYLALPF